MWIKRLLTEENLVKVEKLSRIAERRGITMSQLALAWILRLDNVSSCIIGASRVEQLEENVKASGIRLTEEELKEIEAILGGDQEA